MANLSNINNKFLVTTGGNVLIGQTADDGNRLQIDGDAIIKNGTYGKILLRSSSNYLYGDVNGVLIAAASNNLRLYTAGTQRLRIDSSGNSTFAGNITGVGATFVGVAASGTALVTIENNSGSTATSYGLLVVGGGNSSNGRTFEVRDASGNTDLIVKGNGDVGIGTASPGYPLEVNGRVAISSASAPQLLFFEPGRTYTEAMRLLRYEDKLSLTYGWNANEEALTVVGTGSTAGYVGIGTISPDSKLDVKGASATPADGNQTLSITNTTGGTQLNIGTAENSYGWIEAREGATLRNLLLNPNGGNVGIGTASPFTNLEIEGSGLDSIIRLYAASGAANIRTWEIRAVGVAGEGLLFRQVDDANSSYTNRMIIDTSGNVGIGTISLTEKLRVQGVSGSDLLVRFQPFTNNASSKLYLSSVSSGDGGYYYNSNNNTAGLFSYGDYTFNVGTANISGAIGDPRMVILQGGNVGINITSPQDKLHVNGDAIISSTRFGDFAVAGLNTTGVVVARVDSSTNGQSAIVEFVASGNNGAYYNVVYSCYNGGGAWFYSKNVVGSGGNIEVAETNGGGSSELTFKFRATSGTASYTPRVMMKGMPYNLVTF